MQSSRNRHFLLIAAIFLLVLSWLPLNANGQGKTASSVVVTNTATQPVPVRDVDQQPRSAVVIRARIEFSGGNPLPRDVTPPIPAGGCFVIETVAGGVSTVNDSDVGTIHVYMNMYRGSFTQENYLYGVGFLPVSIGNAKQFHQQTKLYVANDSLVYLGFFGAVGTGEGMFTIVGYIENNCSVAVTVK